MAAEIEKDASDTATAETSKPCPSCQRSMPSAQSFCEDCSAIMMDMASQDDLLQDDTCGVSSTTATPVVAGTESTEPNTVTPPASQEMLLEEEEHEQSTNKKQKIQHEIEGSRDNPEATAAVDPADTEKSLDMPASELMKISTVAATPPRQTQALAVVTPPSHPDTPTTKDCDNVVVLNIKIQSADTATKLWLLEAQGKASPLNISFPNSNDKSAQGHITSLTLLSPGQDASGNITKVESKKSLVAKKNKCSDCGIDSDTPRCRKCYAIFQVANGQGKKRGNCEVCGIKTEKSWMYLCHSHYLENKKSAEAVEAEQSENAKLFKNCRDCNTLFKREFDFMTRCEPCYGAWRKKHAVNMGGTCRYCKKSLNNELKTTCGDCFQKHKVNSPSGSKTCPSCGKPPEEPKWMIWCRSCYREQNKSAKS